jgi:hypothetical protein
MEFDSLASALPIAFSLVGIDFAHAFEKVLCVWFVHFWRAWSVAAAAMAGSYWPIFLSLVRHKFICLSKNLYDLILKSNSQKNLI